jgi:hypothetical protein
LNIILLFYTFINNIASAYFKYKECITPKTNLNNN